MDTHGMKAISLRKSRWGVAFLLSSALTLAACFKSSTTGDDSLAGIYAVQIQGRLLHKNGYPLSGAVVKLVGIGAADTSDDDGRYLIVIRKSAEGDSTVSSDTFELSVEGQVVSRREIQSLVDSLPTLTVLQRKISGGFGPSQDEVGRIEAVLMESGEDGGVPSRIGLFFNALTREFNGTLYFLERPGKVEYTLKVEAFDQDDQWIISTPLLEFNSLAADLNLPVTAIVKPNSIRGRLLGSNRRPVAGVKMSLLASSHVPTPPLAKGTVPDVDTTDSRGYYEFKKPDTGFYNLSGGNDSLGVLIDSIRVGKDTTPVLLPDTALKAYGSISGVARMLGQGDTDQVRITIHLPGTERIARPSIGGRFSIRNVPEGRYRIILDPTLDDYPVKVFDTLVRAGEHLDLDTVRLVRKEPDTIKVNTPFVFGTWGPDKIYAVMNDLEIPSGETLQILPGTRILFMGRYGLRVKGALKATGSAEKMILFTSGSPAASVTWGEMEGKEFDSVVLEYCIVERYSQFSIWYTNPGYRVSISNSVFRYAGGGISLDLWNSSGRTMVQNNVFHDLQGIACYLHIPESVLLQVVSRNNIFYRVGSVEGSVSDDYTPYSGDYNCYFEYATFTQTVNDRLKKSQPGPNSILQDPQFSNLIRGSEDYHLKPESPCRGKGEGGVDMGIHAVVPDTD